MVGPIVLLPGQVDSGNIYMDVYIFTCRYRINAGMYTDQFDNFLLVYIFFLSIHKGPFAPIIKHTGSPQHFELPHVFICYQFVVTQI